MKIRLMIPALLAVAVSASAFAHGGDRDDWRDQRGWHEERHDHWRHHHRHDHWRYGHRPPPPPYAYGYGYPPPPPRVYYEAPAVHLPLPPLPPPPHEVIRDILRGH